MDQKTIDEWESETKNKKKLPERLHKKEAHWDIPLRAAIKALQEADKKKSKKHAPEKTANVDPFRALLTAIRASKGIENRWEMPKAPGIDYFFPPEEPIESLSPVEVAAVVNNVPLTSIVKAGAYDFEKEAIAWQPFLKGGLSAAKALGHAGLRAGRYIGEAATNIGIGGRGGMAMGEILDPVFRSKNIRLPKQKWDPFFGVKSIGKLRKVEPKGGLKGMYQYAPKAGLDEFTYQPITGGLGNQVMQRIKNFPKFMWQEIRGGTPTRADQLLRGMGRCRRGAAVLGALHGHRGPL
jgi:hypothetical protein